MNINKKSNNNNQDHLNILRTISKKSEITQRKMANKLGFSLGKLNYCLRALSGLSPKLYSSLKGVRSVRSVRSVHPRGDLIIENIGIKKI